MSKKHPEWALKHRKPGTELRFISGHYYLYEVSSKWDKVSKRTKKITGKIIGKIKPDGELVPSKRRENKDKGIEKNPLSFVSTISVKEYGLSHFLVHHMRDVTKELKKHFPDHWPYIISVAYCRLIKQLPIKRMPLHIYHSYLTEYFPDVKFDEKNISLALRDVGRDRESVVKFMRWKVPRGEHVLVDMTDLPSKSRNGAFARPGRKNFSGQINLLYIFGNQSLKPVFYRLLPGNIRELSAFELSLKESGVKNCILIMDKGFYSKKNIGFLDGKGFRYICPLKRNSSLVAEENRNKLFDKEEAEFFEYGGKIIWYVKLKHNDKKVYLYLDEETRVKEERDYLGRVSNKPESYTMEKFHEKKKQFGTLALFTNLGRKSAEQIYTIYKSRNQIEVMFDGLKGVLEVDKTYMQNEETLQGWMFANHIALLAHHRLYRLLLDSDKLKKNSVKYIIDRLVLVKKAKINSQWVDTEVIKATTELFNEIGIPIT